MKPLTVIAFRADASLEIGTGHVMRCLTLADAFLARGAECHFLCRPHDGNLIDFIRAKGFQAHQLGGPAAPGVELGQGDEPAHAAWLGTSQDGDAAECEPILRALQTNCLIVDHYALDARWEARLRPLCRRLWVIDDLADRPHRCDLVLDQTFGRAPADYASLVPAGCVLLCGSRYALLRPEFAALREYSLSRRASPRLERLLITMGGVDKDDATGKVLEAIRHATLPADCRITVVMGSQSPWLARIRRLAEAMPWPTKVLVGVSDMARLMADSDLAIGAAGATSWERCCLGLPAVMVILAENQQLVARGLQEAGAALVLGDREQISVQLPDVLNALRCSPPRLAAMSQLAAGIADGQGVATLVQYALGEPS